MRRWTFAPPAVAVTAALLCGPASGHSPSSAEEEEIAAQLVRACPGQRALVEQAARDFHVPAHRVQALVAYKKVASCAKAVPILHVRLGLLYLEAHDLVAAEASYRAGVRLDPSYSNKLSLLQALARADKPEAATLFAELKTYDGDRPDIWASLAYVALHREDVPFMKKAAGKAIALGTQLWQPYYVAATAEGLQPRPDYARALGWLTRADELAAPPKLTGALRDALQRASAKITP